MKAGVVFVVCAILGASLAYNVQREAPYNSGPNNPFGVEVNSNFLQQPSQRLFWDKFGNSSPGSNQVGGGGLWQKFTNKFPMLSSMFGRMELAPEYGAPAINPQYYEQPHQQYSPPRFQQFPQQQFPQQQFPQQQFPQQRFPQQQFPQQQFPQQQFPQQRFPQQQFPQQQFPQQQFPQQQFPRQQFPQQQFFRQSNSAGRDVGFTDDAIIVTPPQVPIAPIPAPIPVPAPAPIPSPVGYSYDKPQNRLELPHK